MISHFISDLHLCDEQPHLLRLFDHYMEVLAPEADRLYILGDLFETWVGDDDDASLARSVIDRLRAWSGAGGELYLMHGNRDFLIGDDFARATGGILLDDPHLMTLAGRPTLLMHGDTLCTDDTDYQQFRRMVRDPGWQRQLLSQTLAVRRQLAAEIRGKSRAAMAGKDEAIMDVNDEAVSQVFREHGAGLLIHGHTHRPAVHQCQVNGTACERWVLGDWGERGNVLICGEEGELQSRWFAPE